MPSSTNSLIGRRGILRLGAFAGLSSALMPGLPFSRAHGAATPVFCNGDRPNTPAEALDTLIEGNQRWFTLKQQHPGEDPDRRACVVGVDQGGHGQTPYAAVISCSDSRVSPELVFDQGIGDLFVARVAGNGATGKLAESLFYGTEVLGALVLLVLGHSDCGAVKVAVDSFPRHNLEFVELIFPAVKAARRIVKESGGNPNDPKQVVPVATDQNVILTVQELRKSPFFHRRVRDGLLLIAGGVYDLETQQVNVLIQ